MSVCHVGGLIGPTKLMAHLLKGSSAVTGKRGSSSLSVGLSHPLTYITVLAVILSIDEERGPPESYMRRTLCASGLADVMAPNNSFMCLI
jgi:hypothetical protein